MIYILFGPDEFSLRKELVRIKDGMGSGEMLETNTTEFDARTLTPEQLMSTCDTVPFLAEKRLVIVNGLLGRFESPKKKNRDKRTSAKSGDLKKWVALKKYADRMPQAAVLVLVDGDIEEKGNRLFKEIQSVAEVKKFTLLKGRRLHHWINSRVVDHKGSISPQAVALLADLVGSNLGVLSSEIEKLLLYVGGRCIEEEDVENLVSYTRNTSIFTLVDAVLEQRVSRAMLLLHRLLAEGVAPSHIVVMIARQLRLFILAKEIAAQDVPYKEAQRRLGLYSDYPFRQTMNQSSIHPVKRLEVAYHKLLDADVAMKTGEWKSIRNEKWKDELILDVLIAEMCYTSI
ncbi:MAG: DNA polymerase III subunit delta [Dehalococcoidia bacterium]|nr:DNA polymerase III subunit delta [Dehalococcoidia bacterium]